MHPYWRSVFASSVVAILTLGASVRGQCADPPTPPGGFATTMQADQLITLTDGYKTRADVYRPQAQAGPCGWPLLIAIHGGPSPRGKLDLRSENQSLASHGFLTVGYDVRGQGYSHSLNPGQGGKLMALDEWIDMFEVIEWALGKYRGLVDPNRIGVYGTSQGGWHAWAAAAYSGKAPPPNRRRSKPFPVVTAAVPRYINPAFHDSEIPNGTLFKSVLVPLGYYTVGQGWNFDSTVQQAWQTYLDRDDPAGLRSWIRNDPGRDFLAELKTTKTAVFAILSWHDWHAAPNRALDILQSMPKTTPRRIVLDTGGHGSPYNNYQYVMRWTYTRQWLRRFLKRWAEPIEQGPPVVLASIPANTADYRSGGSLWRHRADANVPADDVSAQRYYLRDQGRLTTQPPAANEPANKLQHRAPAGYTMRTFLQDGAGGNLPLIFSKMPHQQLRYRTDPMPVDREISGVPLLDLAVTPNTGNYYVAAQLLGVPPNQPAQLLASGALGVRGQPGARTIRIEMDVANSVLPAGHRLELVVQNHLVVESPSPRLRYVPFFRSYDVQIDQRRDRSSSLLLPMRPRVRPDVSASATSISTKVPAPVPMTLRSSPARRGLPYVLLCSLSGQQPMLRLANGPLHLSWDPVTTLFLGAANTPMLRGFLGVLDAQGEARATLDLGPVQPVLPSLFWSNLHVAPVLLDLGGYAAGAPLFFEFQ